jgi:hypothetical protein
LFAFLPSFDELRMAFSVDEARNVIPSGFGEYLV